MPRQGCRAKAPHRGAFCVWTLLWLSLSLFGAQVAWACGADMIDERVRVDHVYDGDTVRLVDGRRLRLIGVDTPELNHREGRPDPFAQAAREATERLVGGAELHLRFDTERRDRYGRLLAHAFLPDGRSLSRILIGDGLGTQLTVPPNVWNVDCLSAAEREAQAARRGIWALADYAARPASEVQREEGFCLIRGRVERVGSARKSIWLNLDGPVAVRIAREDLHWFGGAAELQALQGRTVVVRGWLRPHNYNNGVMLRVRHPAALQVLDRY